ncbi:hypothetical protein C8J56DRAFT_242439 [Mycena floridula]|nr:hypothetical protein C8J56DRAFT_242439 [Mycena floridula]
MSFYSTGWPVQLLWIRRLGVSAWFPIHYAKSHSMDAGYNLFSGDHQALIRLSHAHFTPECDRTAETFGNVEMERYPRKKKRAGSDCTKCISTKSGNRMRRKRLHFANAESDLVIHVQGSFGTRHRYNKLCSVLLLLHGPQREEMPPISDRRRDKLRWERHIEQHLWSEPRLQ